MKNSTNLFTLKGKTATQSVGLAPKTYARAKALATELNCKIDFVDHNFLKVTAPTAKIAKQFENTIQSEYDITSALYAEAKAQKSSTSKPTASKGKAKATTSSTKKTVKTDKKPKASKGNAFDYSVIKGETKSDKNRALHAMLVSKGIADSRTPEYQAVWSARPWAK